MPMVLDLNADVGEGVGDDAALLALVTSANVAAGAHAGGGDVLLTTVDLAIGFGCAIGAHPSYRDRENFGRVSRAADVTPDELRRDLIEQIVDVGRTVAERGSTLRHVKAHGALYHDAALSRDLAGVLVDAVRVAAGLLGCPLLIVGPPDCELAIVAAAHQLGYRAEAFADRRYTAEGTLVPRTESGAVLHERDAVVEQAVALGTGGHVTAEDGTRIAVAARTLCVHGDTPGAVELAAAIRTALSRAGVRLTADGH